VLHRRRFLLLAGVAPLALALPQTIAAPVQTATLQYRDMMLSELEELYDGPYGMMRNCGPDIRAMVEGSGPLSGDWFFFQRQIVYRRIIRLRHGVIYAEHEGEIMHHPV